MAYASVIRVKLKKYDVWDHKEYLLNKISCPLNTWDKKKTSPELRNVATTTTENKAVAEQSDSETKDRFDIWSLRIQPSIWVEILSRQLEIQDRESIEQLYLEQLNLQESAKTDIKKDVFK